MTKQDYTEALKAKADNNAEFDALVATLRADKTIRQSEMREIAIDFIGYQIAQSKTRKWSLQQIVDRQALDARQIARGAVLQRSLNSW